MKKHLELEARCEVPVAERIARRAHGHWEADGYPEGADLRHWLRAEAELPGKMDSALFDESPEHL